VLELLSGRAPRDQPVQTQTIELGGHLDRARLRRRSPRGQRPLRRTILVLAAVSSMKSRLDRPNGCILVESTDGPLRELLTRWTFRSRSGAGCDVGFYLQYEFANRALALLMGPVFDVAFGRFVQAFERRADTVYRGRHVCISPQPISR